MKKLIIYFILLFSLSATAQVKVVGSIEPNSLSDTYPTHTDIYGKGGFMSVATITERNAIATDRRKELMLVGVVADQKVYQLKGGTANANWIEFSSGLSVESDPVFAGHVAYGITGTNISTWNSALTSESDPIFSAHPLFPVTSGIMTNWTTGYNKRITGATVSGTSSKLLTLTQGDGSTVTASWPDLEGTGADGNNYSTGVSVSSTGVTVNRSGLSDITGNFPSSLSVDISGNSATTTLAANSTQLGGMNPSTGTGSNTIATRDASGYLFATYLNTTAPNSEAGTISQIFYNNGSDGFLRKANLSQIQTALGLGSNAYTSTSYLPLTAGSGNPLSGVLISNITANSILSNTASSTSRKYMEITNTGASGYFGIESSASGGFFSGSTPYATIFGSANGTASEIAAGGTVGYSMSSDRNHNFKSGTATFGGNIDITKANSFLDLNSTSGTSSIGFRHANTYAGYLSSISGGGILFGTGSSASEKMRITNSGDVLIGTTTAEAKLDVKGGAFIVDTENNGYGGLKIETDAVSDYNVNFRAGRGGPASGFKWFTQARPSGSGAFGTGALRMTLTGNGDLTVGGIGVFGNAKIGSSTGFGSGYARFGHVDQDNSGNYGYLQLSNGNNYIGGPLELAHSLTGTSANFTGELQINAPATRLMSLNSTATSGAYIRFQKSGADEFFLGRSESVGGTSGYYDFYSVAGKGIEFYTNAGSVPMLKLNTDYTTDFSGIIKANSVGGNMRLKADGSSDLDAGIYTAADGTLNIKNWNGTRGISLNPNNTVSFTGSLAASNAEFSGYVYTTSRFLASNNIPLSGYNVGSSAEVPMIKVNTSNQVYIDPSGYGSVFGGTVNATNGLTAPTRSADDATTNVATTAFVQNQIGASAGVKQLKDFSYTANTSGSGLTTMYAFIMNPDVLSVDGQKMRFMYAGTTASNSNTKTLNFLFGINQLFFPNMSTANTSWKLEIELIRTSNTDARLIATLNTGGLAGQSTQVTSTTQMDFSDYQNFILRGTGVSNQDITGMMGNISWFAAAP